MKNTLINCALFAAIVATMFSIQVIDNGAEHEVAIEELAKQNRQDRFDRAAREICGENATYTLTHKQGEIVCKTRRGQKTKVAQL